MGWSRWLRMAVFVVGAALGGSVGAEAQSDSALGALTNGRLVLWVVHPATKAWTPELAANNPALGPQATSREIHEQTAGSFGTAASNVGQNAASYGQAPSTLGQNASDAGTSASNYGQTAGSYGTASSDVGQTAGSYGQTASSYGQASSTFGESIGGVSNATGPVSRTASSAAKQQQLNALLARLLKHAHVREWDGLASTLKGEFPGLDVVIYDVREEDLSDAMRWAANTQDAPDVLLGAPMPWKWAKLSGGVKTRLVVATLGGKVSSQGAGVFIPVSRMRFSWGPELAILADAPHPERARSFAVWMADGAACSSCATTDESGAGTVALRAVDAVIEGGSVDGDADPEMARASAALVRAALLGGAGGGDKLVVTGDVLGSLSNDRFAAVAVRAMVSSGRTRSGPGAFGVLHALVLLRRETAAAKWHVLQISPEMTGEILSGAMGMIDESVDFSAKGKVLGVSLAAPPDGDTRGPRPDLWWDNHGGAGLEMVEWQRRGENNGWSGSKLVFLPDRTGEVKTRVTADFATESAAYRWRVWQVGDGGAVVLSPWRTMNIVP